MHGVTGSSRTFMGEEAAGVDAVRIALARIASGQSDIALVGAAHNGERKDMLMLYEFGNFNLKGEFAPVWSRAPKGGFALGSGGAFLVLESKRHAEARGAKPYAKISRVLADRAIRKQPGRIAESLEGLWAKLKVGAGATAIITGITGAEPATAEERQFLAHHKDIPVRATATRFGHLVEAQFPLGLALAALAIKHGKLFPPGDKTGAEIEMPAPPSQIVVVGTGHWRGEGMALVEPV